MDSIALGHFIGIYNESKVGLVYGLGIEDEKRDISPEKENLIGKKEEEANVNVPNLFFVKVNLVTIL